MDTKRVFLSLLSLAIVQTSHAQVSLPEREEPLRVQSHRCSNNASYKVHLTFDDGPKIPETLRILDILKKYNIKATFFISTNRFRNYVRAGAAPTASEQQMLQVIERMKREGHTVGNHSFEHIEHGSIRNNSRQDIERNLMRSYDVMDKLKLPRPIPFRFPYGSGWLPESDPANQAMSDVSLRSIKLHGYRPFHWDIDTEDWSKVKRKALPQSMLQQVCAKGGGVALMHDIHPWTVDNLEAMIASLHQSGHQIVSNAEIVRYSETNPRGPFSSLVDQIRPQTQRGSGASGLQRGVN